MKRNTVLAMILDVLEVNNNINIILLLYQGILE